MNEETMSELKEILKQNDIKESLIDVMEKINNLTELEYILNVVSFINDVDELINNSIANKKMNSFFELYVNNKENGKTRYLSCDFYFDGNEVTKEEKEKTNELCYFLERFSKNSGNKILCKNFLVMMELEHYSKSKLTDEIFENMLNPETHKMVNFLVLQNSTISTINNSSNLTQRKIKI